MVRWNDRTTVQLVQFEYEDKPTARAVRLTCPASRVGDPVRVRVGGAEVEGTISEVAIHVLHVRIGRRLF